jgi:hypothetical protein
MELTSLPPLEELSPAELEALWAEAKRKLASSSEESSHPATTSSVPKP